VGFGAEKGAKFRSRELTLAPPVPRDAKIVCAAINYVQARRRGKPADAGFSKPVSRDGPPNSSCMASIFPVPAPNRRDSTGKLNSPPIVGRYHHRCDESTAAANVFGYTVANDRQRRAAQLQSTTLSTGQWALGQECGQELPHRLLVVTATPFRLRT